MLNYQRVYYDILGSYEKNYGLGTPEVAFTSSTSSSNIYTLKIHENLAFPTGSPN